MFLIKQKNIGILFFSFVFILVFLSFDLQRSFAVTFAPNVRPLSPRVQGMGGAFGALANDSQMLFYNPAGILHRNKYGTDKGEALFTVMNLGWRGYKSYLKDYEVDAGDLALGIVNPVDFLDRLDFQGFSKDFNDIESTQGESIQDRFNSIYGAGVQGPFHISYLARGWGVSYLASYTDISVRMYNGLLPKTAVYAYNTNIAQAAYGIPLQLAGKDFYIGVAVKYQSLVYLDRQGVDSLSAASWPTNEKDPFASMILENSYYGAGPGIDFGLLYQAHKSVRLGFSLLNAPTYLLAEKSGLVQGEKNRFVSPVAIASVLYEPYWFKDWLQSSWLGSIFTGLRLLVDYELDGRSLDEQWNFWYGWKAGIETSWWLWKGVRSLFFLRAGIHQGYYTWGAGLDLFYVKLDYAYFREEMGPKAGSIEQTTHNASLRIEW